MRSKRGEPDQRPCVAYLGPHGTFTELAILTQPDLAAMRHRLEPDVMKVLNAADAGEADFGFAAIENMIEGSVTAALDTLAFETNLLIQREVVIGVNLNLLVPRGVTLDKIECIRTFGVAYAQCRRYLQEHLPDAIVQAANSTADAARELAESDARNTAAIAPQRSAEVYDLEVLASDIEDHPENQTRFVLVARGGSIPPPTGHDKTSLLVFQRSDVPGSLMGLLSEFASRSVNLTSLQSRPTKARLGQYCFLIDCEGHIADEVVGDALRNLYMKAADVKLLGSYPSAYGTNEEQQNNREVMRTADEWLGRLRAGIGRS